MVNILWVYVPVAGETVQGATRSSCSPGCSTTRSIPFAHEPWRYLDIDLARCRAQVNVELRPWRRSPTEPQPKTGLVGQRSRSWRWCSCSRASSRTGRGCSSRPRRSPRRPTATRRVDLAAVARLFGARRPGRRRRRLDLGAAAEGRDRARRRAPSASAIFSTGAGSDIAVYVEREVAAGREARRGASRPRHRVARRRARAHRPRGARAAPRRGAAAVRGRARPGFRINVARSRLEQLQPLAQGARRRAARSRTSSTTSADRHAARRRRAHGSRAQRQPRAEAGPAARRRHQEGERPAGRLRRRPRAPLPAVRHHSR